MFVIVVCHGHAEGFGGFFVAFLLHVTQLDEFPIAFVGHQGEDDVQIVAFDGT